MYDEEQFYSEELLMYVSLTRDPHGSFTRTEEGSEHISATHDKTGAWKGSHIIFEVQRGKQ